MCAKDEKCIASLIVRIKPMKGWKLRFTWKHHRHDYHRFTNTPLVIQTKRTKRTLKSWCSFFYLCRLVQLGTHVIPVWIFASPESYREEDDERWWLWPRIQLHFNIEDIPKTMCEETKKRNSSYAAQSYMLYENESFAIIKTQIHAAMIA